MIGAARREGLAHSIPPAARGLFCDWYRHIGGTLEFAQQIAAHESTPTAKLHHRTAAWSRSRKWNAAKSEVVHYIQPVLARNEV
jgi:hypothetical protein